MSRTLYSLFGAGLLLAAFPLLAQAPDPPKVLRIIREDVKEGKAGPHEKAELKIAQMFAKNKFPAYYMGMTALTGPNQAWFLEPHDSFAAIADEIAAQDKLTEFDTLDAVDAEYRTGTRISVAVYRPDLSYHATQLMEGMPKARFFNIITMRIRMARDQEFTDLAKQAIIALEKSGADQPAVTYQVVSGMPVGTYLLMEPTASMKALDDAPARSRAWMEAMGESGAKQFMKGVGDLIVNEESVLFAINPKMSYVSKEFAAGDPEFWNPKPVVSKAKPIEKATAAK
jgi:hypothetical protein